MKKSFVKVFVSVMLLLLMTVVLCFGVGAFVEGPTMEEFHENIEQYIDYDVFDGKAIINNVNIEGYLMWDITIPSSLGGYPVTELSDGCFMYCTLDNIIIPETVTAIGDLFFDGSCTGYIVDANNPCFSSENENEYNGGALFNKDKTELLKFPIGDGDAFNIKTEYKIPDTVKIIGEAAFSGCNSLEAVTVSDSVTKIGNSAFENCENLKSVALGKNIEEIGMSAFLYCYSLNEVKYTGSEADWEKISIASGNDYLLEADIEFNYDPASAYKCGDNAFWAFDEEALTLTISGTGDMYDYDYLGRGPWYKQIDKLIEYAKIKVVVEVGDLSDSLYAWDGFCKIWLVHTKRPSGENFPAVVGVLLSLVVISRDFYIF